MEKSKVELKTPKLLGGIGSILIILTPFITPLGGVVGLTLIAFAMHKFSEIYKEKDIFNKYIIGLALGVVSFVVFFALGLGSLFTAGIFSDDAEDGIARFGFGVVLGGILAYILSIISGYYYKKAYESLSIKSGQKLFATGGLLLFVGQILIILLGLGYLIALVGFILIAISYFTLPSEVEVS